MPQSILESVTLGYEPLWNQWRKRMGVRLLVEASDPGAVDARHLVATIAELCPASAHPLLLSIDTPSLRSDLLELEMPEGVWLEIQAPWLADAAFVDQVRDAARRSVPMVWRGEPGEEPSQTLQGCFYKQLRCLSAQEALVALRVALRQNQHADSGSVYGAMHSPVVAGGLYEGLASPALVAHALDRQGALGVLGWPTDEVLHGYRFKKIQPARHLILAVLRSIDADESMAVIEHQMGNDPLLTLRFLRYANSAGLGLSRDIDCVRQGLMAMGYEKLRTWLVEQLPHASSDLNLDPIRAAIVLRARIMERLANAGAEEDLRREVFLCGLFSQMDLLLGEPLGTTLHRQPLPERLVWAILAHTGPYLRWLEAATALESGSTKRIRSVCTAHNLSAEEVNRALLRALAPD